jgi:intracellular septation protein
LRRRGAGPLSSDGAPARQPPRWLGPAMDCGPLAVFFVAYMGWNLFVATAAMLLATAVALVLSLTVARHVPITALVSAALLAIFGGLTLWLNDADYLKLQSTVISSLFSLVLFGALALRRQLLRRLFGAALPLDDEGWRVLTMRCAVFFATLASLNELIARTQSTAIWVDFNVFGSTAISLIFIVAQWPLIKRHRVPVP